METRQYTVKAQRLFDRMVERRARNLIKRHPLVCSCRGPEIGYSGHAPDCSWVQDQDQAYSDAEEATEAHFDEHRELAEAILDRYLSRDEEEELAAALASRSEKSWVSGLSRSASWGEWQGYAGIDPVGGTS